jgi:hypothetical protein
MPSGVRPIIGLRLSENEIARVDRWAVEQGVSRSQAVRLLIERGLPPSEKYGNATLLTRWLAARGTAMGWSQLTLAHKRSSGSMTFFI